MLFAFRGPPPSVPFWCDKGQYEIGKSPISFFLLSHNNFAFHLQITEYNKRISFQVLATTSWARNKLELSLLRFSILIRLYKKWKLILRREIEMNFMLARADSHKIPDSCTFSLSSFCSHFHFAWKVTFQLSSYAALFVEEFPEKVYKVNAKVH